MRLYRLTQLLSCPPSVVDEQSAVDMDWLLAIDDMLKQVEQRKAERKK